VVRAVVGAVAVVDDAVVGAVAGAVLRAVMVVVEALVGAVAMVAGRVIAAVAGLGGDGRARADGEDAEGGQDLACFGHADTVPPTWSRFQRTLVLGRRG
jgi:hypothetical protein